MANQLQEKVASKSTLQQERDNILQHIIPSRYEYQLESVLVHLRLQKSDFNTNYSMPYPPHHPIESRRGRENGQSPTTVHVTLQLRI